MNGVWYERGQLQGTWLGTPAAAGREPVCNNRGAGGVEKALAEAGRTVVYGINFDTDSDRLRNESTPVLNGILDSLKKQTSWRIGIEGHTDTQGADQYNQQLSDRRAAAVRQWLVDHGVAASRLESRGYGEARPVADNATPQGRFLNRRVELSLLR